MTMHRILIIGTGSIGERHARCMLATKRTEVGICEPNPEVRSMVAERYEISDVYATLDQAMQSNWGAAVIATPAPLHIPIAHRLAQAGISLLIEKPLSTSIEGVDELNRAVESNGIVAAVAYIHRAHPSLAGMQRAIADGRIGRPLQLVAVSGANFAAARPAYREAYYAKRDTGGGAIQDALTHVFNAGEWLVGPITRVAADAQHQ